MHKLILQRFLALIPLLLAVAIGSFLLVQLAPGDFLSEMSLNPQVSKETIDRIRQQYGLDQAWYIQFLKWLAAIVRGDWGYSFAYNRPAAELIAERLPNTALLAFGGMALSLGAAIPAGIFAARYRSGLFDRLASICTAINLSAPMFLVALLAVVLAARTEWFPIGGILSIEYENLSVAGKMIDRFHHLILPALVLSIGQIPGYFRQIRASLLETISQDFILAARARGVPEHRIWMRHAFRNAINPTITMFGDSIGSLLSGAFIVETIMSWPGLGNLTVSSLLSRDLYVLVACLVFAALLLMLGNLLADILLAMTDPRIRSSLWLKSQNV